MLSELLLPREWNWIGQKQSYKIKYGNQFNESMNLGYKSEETVHGSQGGADPLTFKGKKTWMESTTHKSRLKTDDKRRADSTEQGRKNPSKMPMDGCIHRYPYGGPMVHASSSTTSWMGKGKGMVDGDP